MAAEGFFAAALMSKTIRHCAEPCKSFLRGCDKKVPGYARGVPRTRNVLRVRSEPRDGFVSGAPFGRRVAEGFPA